MPIQNFISFLQANPGFVSIVSLMSGSIGVYIGHRLAIGRDRRQEFNAVALRLRSIYLSQQRAPSPFGKSAAADDLDLFLQLVARWKRRGFRAAVEEYEQAEKKAYTRDTSGGSFYKDDTEIKSAIARLLPYTRMR